MTRYYCDCCDKEMHYTEINKMSYTCEGRILDGEKMKHKMALCNQCIEKINKYIQEMKAREGKE